VSGLVHCRSLAFNSVFEMGHRVGGHTVARDAAGGVGGVEQVTHGW